MIILSCFFAHHQRHPLVELITHYNSTCVTGDLSITLKKIQPNWDLKSEPILAEEPIEQQIEKSTTFMELVEDIAYDKKFKIYSWANSRIERLHEVNETIFQNVQLGKGDLCLLYSQLI